VYIIVLRVFLMFYRICIQSHQPRRSYICGSKRKRQCSGRYTEESTCKLADLYDIARAVIIY